MSGASQEPVYFLLVDDLEENLMALEALLRRDGVVMIKANSGASALELLLIHDFSLALVDVQMPGMDGFELAELMRGADRTKRVPIIFLTAGTSDWQRRFRGYEAGAVDFLQKPIEADILRSKVDVFFQLALQQKQLSHQRDELKLYADALKEADRRKDEFLATLAHELRNPLAPLRNGLQILRMSGNNESSENIRDMMDRQLTHMVRLIDDLLDVSRVSQGKIELRKDYITVQSAIDMAIESSQPLIDTRNHQLKVVMPEDNLWLYADMTRISQVISNILNNAAKYTPEGGKICLTARQDDEILMIDITDNGLGIREDMLPKVFELFTQVDQNLERSQGGLGIGLALVNNLVKMHNGSITAQSAGLGKGSKFIVRLPLSKMPEIQKEDPVSNFSAQPQNKMLKILVVDDNIPSAQTTGWMLELIGHQPSLVHDGLSALEEARKTKPDVILLDIGLPGMNGYDVCRTLREDDNLKDTMIIAQTGWGQERDRRLAIDAGFDHHLVKPVSLDQFSQLLENVSLSRSPRKDVRK